MSRQAQKYLARFSRLSKRQEYTITGMVKGEMEAHERWVLIPVFALVVLLLWMFFGTYYELSPEKGLVYHCGPVSGKISLDRITQIVKGKTLWIGFRPATARKGLVVKYDTFNELYISPKTNDSFIDEIKRLKDTIIISE